MTLQTESGRRVKIVQVGLAEQKQTPIRYAWPDLRKILTGPNHHSFNGQTAVMLHTTAPMKKHD
ncbi:hypothetical protein N9D23_14380 [Rubripirellula sp.]|nr:hypothetical protein [Rubripirellula sp.]